MEQTDYIPSGQVAFEVHVIEGKVAYKVRLDDGRTLTLAFNLPQAQKILREMEMAVAVAEAVAEMPTTLN